MVRKFFTNITVISVVLGEIIQLPKCQWCRKIGEYIKLIYCELIMTTSSNGNIFCVTGPLCGEFTGLGEVPAQRPVTRSFDVFFYLRLNKRFTKQPWGWWFERPSWSLWRHGNGYSHNKTNYTNQNNVHLRKFPNWYYPFCPHLVMFSLRSSQSLVIGGRLQDSQGHTPRLGHLTRKMMKICMTNKF